MVRQPDLVVSFIVKSRYYDVRKKIQGGEVNR